MGITTKTTNTAGLAPITRAYLSSYYDKYPFPPLSDDVAAFSSQLRSYFSEFLLTRDEKVVADEVDYEPPHKIDENIWKNRENIEEIIYLLDYSHWPPKLQQQAAEDQQLASALEQLKLKFEAILNTLQFIQAKNADSVFNKVMSYMPQDFRGTLIRQQKEKSEKNKQAEIDTLVKSGCSIRDRYALLWKQQMDRRRQLAQLGSATGVYKTLVKYLVGVPQVLLDFIRQINDDEGPMEEQRQRYGPPLYSFTKMAITIRIFLFLLWARIGNKEMTKDQLTILTRSAYIYTSEFERFITFMSEVFANSPFLVSAGEVDALESRIDDYKDVTIPAGETHEVVLYVESGNTYIAWDFALEQSKLRKDVGFSVEYTESSGKNTLILPYRRCNSDQGNFCTPTAGSYKLIWDNSYSSFFRKAVFDIDIVDNKLKHMQIVSYKVDCIPPVDAVTESVKQ